jgi:hypothetical protein
MMAPESRRSSGSPRGTFRVARFVDKHFVNDGRPFEIQFANRDLSVWQPKQHHLMGLRAVSSPRGTFGRLCIRHLIEKRKFSAHRISYDAPPENVPDLR